MCLNPVQYFMAKYSSRNITYIIIFVSLSPNFQGGSWLRPTMTTYMQEEYEALALEARPIITDVKVNSTITNHPDELTDKELEKVTAVFRSMETGLREASIHPRVR